MLGPVVAALVVVSSPAAVGEPAPVEITLVGAAPASEATRVVIEELLAGALHLQVRVAQGLDLHEVVTPVAGAAVRTARVWIDLRAPERVTIYIVDGPWERILIRHVPTPDGYGEIAREQVGHITSGSIEALAGGARIGIEREQAARSMGVEPAPAPTPEPKPASAPTSAPPPAAPVDVATWLSASYSAAVFASAPVVTHGPGAGALVELRRPRVRPGFGLTVHYGLPVRITTPDVGLRLDTVGLRGRIALGPRVGERVSLRPWIGVGVDLMRVDTHARSAQAEPFPVFWSPVPILEAGFGVAIALRRALELRVALALEIDPVDTTYAFADSGAPVFDPWLARGLGRLGLAFDPLHWRSAGP